VAPDWSFGNCSSSIARDPTYTSLYPRVYATCEQCRAPCEACDACRGTIVIPVMRR
jgi:hypothetical protein